MASTTAQGQASRVCGLCSGVLWFNLPSEDTSAIPHHKSRKALEASAETCPLCRMVLRAAISNYQVTDPKNRHWREYLKLNVQDETGTRVLMCTRELGNHHPEHNATDRPPLISFAPVGSEFVNGLGSQDSGPLVVCPTREPDAKRRAGSDEELPKMVDLSIESPAEDLPVWIYGNYWRQSGPYDQGKDAPLRLVGIGARFATAHRPIDAFKCEPGYLSLRGSAIRICASDDSALFGHIPGRLPEPQSNSDLAYRRLAAWLNNCLNNHAACKAAASDPKLPTRVIDIPMAHGKAAVVESRGKTGKYVALSHTWGKSPRLTATRKTVGDLMQGVAVSFLPKTFQDAIEITRRLGIRYLWIDCLCIVQDDPEDWEREASAMTHVYRNSHITISASASSDSHSGCFHARTAEAYVSPSMRSLCYDTPRVFSGPAIHTIGYEHQSRPGLRNQIHLYDEWLPGSLSSNPQRDHIGAFGKVIDPVADQPLSSRAWTLQERLLAPRVVHYAEDQIYFECETGTQSECGFKSPNVNFSLQHCLDMQRIPFDQHGVQKDTGISLVPGRASGFKGSPRQQGGWLSLLEDYSRRQLSVPQDKLSAVAGVARVISEETKDTYIAGVWANHLMEDIFWRVYTHEEKFEDEGDHWNGRPARGQLIGLSSVPAQYRAPSWSWASLDAPIKFIPLSYSNLTAQPRNCYATPSGADKYGRVRDGLIDIEGPIFEVMPYRPRTAWDRHGLPVAINLGDERGECIGEVHLDLPDSPMEFPCFALFLDPANALIIRARDNEERVDGQSRPRCSVSRHVLCTTDLAPEMRKPPRGSTILWVGGKDNPDPAKRTPRPVQVTAETFAKFTASLAQEVSLVNDSNHVVRIGVGTFFKDNHYEGERAVPLPKGEKLTLDDIRYVAGDESWGVVTRDDAAIPVQIR